MSKSRIFLDTNVLVYDHDIAKQYHIESADLLTQIIEGRRQGIIAEQTLIEKYPTESIAGHLKHLPSWVEN